MMSRFCCAILGNGLPVVGFVFLEFALVAGSFHMLAQPALSLTKTELCVILRNGMFLTVRTSSPPDVSAYRTASLLQIYPHFSNLVCDRPGGAQN